MPKRKYTQAEWNRIQSRLPQEDREPYSSSPTVLTEEEIASNANVNSGNTVSTTSDSYYVRDPKTGLSPAQVEANQAIAEAVTASGGSITKGATGPNATSDRITFTAEQLKKKREEEYFAAQAAAKGEKPTPPDADEQYIYDYVWRQNVGGPGGKWVLVKTPNTGPADWKFDSNGMLFHKGKAFTGTYNGVQYVDGKGPGYKESGSGNKLPTGLDQATLDLIKSLQDQIANLSAGNQQSAINAAAVAAAEKKEKTENAILVLTDRFNRYGLASLVPRIRELAISGATESTITLQLQESEEYKRRFRANQDRIKKGLRVLEPSDYLNIEDDYRQILRAYGLKQFDNDDYVTQFIANDISTTELSNRVVTAVQRVQNADSAILNTLRSFYGISDNDLVAYVLDPNQQYQKIERQVAAAEIGAAAGVQGLKTGVAVAEQLAAQGITKAQAQKGYATIADILPTAEKLSDIYKSTEDEYRQSEAEQEVFNTLASAQRKRQKLAQRELSAFSAQSGLGKSSLSSQLGGTF